MVFHFTSRNIKMWMMEQPHVKEESLTDWLLFNISKSIPSVYYQAFSRHEEAENGADWEWWILTSDSYIKSSSFNAYRFFVQAKKLTNTGDNYSRLNYGNKNGLQIDLLIENAKAYHAFPFYMFYTTSEPDLDEQKKNIPFVDQKELDWCASCENGCFLSDTNDIFQLIYGATRSRIDDIELLNHSFKLSLLDRLFAPSDCTPECILSAFNEQMVRGRLEQNNLFYQPTGVRGIGRRKVTPIFFDVFLSKIYVHITKVPYHYIQIFFLKTLKKF